MAAFAGPYCKRHMLCSNSDPMLRAVTIKGGYLPAGSRPGGKLVIKDSKGRYNGIRKELKRSQNLGECLVGRVWTQDVHRGVW